MLTKKDIEEIRALDRLGLRRDYKEAKAARGKLPMPVVRE